MKTTAGEVRLKMAGTDFEQRPAFRADATGAGWRPAPG
jgi:hypothetical protein